MKRFLQRVLPARGTSLTGASGGLGEWLAPANRLRLGLALCGMGLFVYAFFIKYTCVLNITGSPAASLFTWLWESWWRSSTDNQHGAFIPIVAGCFAYWRWKHTLRNVPPEVSPWGLPVIGFGFLVYWGAVRAAQPRLLVVALIIVVFGALLYLAGWRWTKGLWFGCAFLVFMIPMDVLIDRLALPLRLTMTTTAVWLLNLFGMEVAQTGTAIVSVAGRFKPLDVADPCSGLRSLVALMALTSFYGYVTMDCAWKKWVLSLSSIPLAMLGNLVRLTTLVFVAQAFGQNWVDKVYHDYAGFITFAIAVLCMMGISTLLMLDPKKWADYWLKPDSKS